MSKQELYTSAAAKYWRDTLSDRLPSEWRKNVDEFEADITLKKMGKVDHKLFAETRLRMGAYGQRYDNGHRYDGKTVRDIPFPEEFKGPETYWDAPGMQRIKLPWGGLTPDQMDLFADLAEEYSDGICHITTRQAIQLHYIHIENCPSMYRRLGALGITTREACGNAVRNVSADPMTGVSPTEAFDVTPYAQAIFEFLLGHPDAQDFGRKFKIALSGDKEGSSGLVNIHDLGLIARIKDGKRGFEFYVGGGLGAVPYAAKLFSDFVSEEEILPLSQAVCRIYARHGEKKKRHRARIKFLIADLGFEKFRDMVIEERAKLPHDPRWTAYLKDLNKLDEKPSRPAGSGLKCTGDAAFDFWVKTNVKPQKQKGYVAVLVTLPLGDITSNQMRNLADICRKYINDTVRTVAEQNLLLRWVSENDVAALYAELKAVGRREGKSLGRLVSDLLASALAGIGPEWRLPFLLGCYSEQVVVTPAQDRARNWLIEHASLFGTAIALGEVAVAARARGREQALAVPQAGLVVDVEILAGLEEGLDRLRVPPARLTLGRVHRLAGDGVAEDDPGLRAGLGLRAGRDGHRRGEGEKGDAGRTYDEHLLSGS